MLKITRKIKNQSFSCLTILFSFINIFYSNLTLTFLMSLQEFTFSYNNINSRKSPIQNGEVNLTLVIIEI
jgi:hypothetical protein